MYTARFYLMVFLSFLVLPFQAYAQSLAVDIEKGVAWLAAQQQSDGSYIGPNDLSFPEQTISETLSTYRILGVTIDAAQTKGYAYLEAQPAFNTEWLARKIIASVENGVLDATLVAELQRYQNHDGGFGASEGYSSSTLDTSWAIKALAVAGKGKNDQSKAGLEWLLARQQASGSWQTAVGDDHFILTVLAIDAVWHYRHLYNVNTSLEKGRNWLKTQKSAAGEWGSNWNNAHALFAILSGLKTADSEQTAVDALAQAQETNGSWEEDAYLSALALRVLFSAKGITNPDLASITGVLVDADTDMPLANLTVKLAQSALTVITDASGRFRFSGLVAGPEQLSVEAPAYRPFNSVLNLTAGQTLDLGALRLIPGAGTDVVITGTGRYWNGSYGEHIAANALIQVGSLQTRTDGNGQYKLTGIPAGQLTIEASYSSYPKIRTGVTARAGDTIALDFLFREADTPNNKLTFKVTDASTGQPLSGVTVTLDPAGAAHSVTTNSQGSAIHSAGLVDGSNHFRIFYNSSYEALQLKIELAGWVETEIPIQLKHRTESGTVLKGIVTDAATHLPLEGVLVTIPAKGLMTQTNAHGEYLLDLNAAGAISKQEVRFEKTGYDMGSTTINVASNTTSVLNAALRSQQSAQESSLKVTVTDRSTHLPLAAVSVILSGANNKTVQTGADGRVSIVPLLVGDTRVQVNLAGYESAYAAFKVEKGQTYELPVELLPESYPTPTLHGYIYDSQTKQPLSGVQLALSGSHSATAATDLQGRYHFDHVVSGDMTLRVQHPNYVTQDLSVAFQNSTEINIALDPEAIVSPGQWGIVGTIVDGHNLEALVGASIRIQQSIPGLQVVSEHTLVSGANGAFAFAELVYSDIRLIIELAGYDTAVIPITRYGSNNPLQLGAVKLNRSYNAAQPDLMLKNTDRSGLVIDQNTFNANGTVAVTVYNNSTYDAGAFTVTAFIDNNNNQVWDDGIDTAVDQIRVAGLLQQHEQNLTFTVRNVKLPFYDAPLYIMADSGLEVAETIEGNNLATLIASCNVGGGVRDVAVCIDISGSVGYLYKTEIEGAVKALENPNIIPHDSSIRFTLGTDHEMYYDPFIPLHEAVIVSPATLPGLIHDLNTKPVYSGYGYSSGPTCALKLSEYLKTLSPPSTNKTLILLGDGYWEGIHKAQTTVPLTVANGVSRIDVIGIGSINLKELEANAWPLPVNSQHGGRVTHALTAGEVATAMAQALSVVLQTIDLTIGKLQLIDHGAGQPVSLKARIGNAGTQSLETTVRFYQGATLLGERPIKALKTGDYLDVTLDGVSLASDDPIVAIIDEDRINAECNISNNMQQIAVAASNRLAALSVATDQPRYPANSAATLRGVATNLGNYPAAFLLQLSIVDTAGSEVLSFSKTALGNVPVTGTASHDEVWNTQTILAGEYHLVGVLYDNSGDALATARQAFMIEAAAPGEAAASLRVVTDKAEYAPDDRVLLDAFARNLSSNALLQGVTSTLTVTGPTGATVFTHTQSIGDMGMNSVWQYNVAQHLNNAALGVYTVAGQLVDKHGVQLATGRATYKVANIGEGAIRHLNGVLTLDKSTLYPWENLNRSDTIKNTGTQAIADLWVERLIVRDSDNTEIHRLEDTLSLTPNQTHTWPDVTINMTGLTAGAYTAVLVAESAGKLQLLDSEPFTVKEGFTGSTLSQGTLISTGAALNEDGQVLVWGYRGTAQQGNGLRFVPSQSPAGRVNHLQELIELTAGTYHMIGLDIDGNVYGWGQGNHGETGCPKTALAPCQIMIRNAVQIAAGEHFSIALDTHGQVWTWGQNLYGQLGNGSIANGQYPVLVNLQGDKARLIGAAYEGAFAVTEQGHVWVWGDNEASGLGIQGPRYGVRSILRTPTRAPLLEPYADRITYIAGGNGWGEALLKDGTVIGWGLRAALGQSVTRTDISHPQPIPILDNIKQLFARYNGSVALSRDGKLYTWGHNTNRMLSMVYGETVTYRSQVHGKAVDIGGGREHILYKTENGNIYGVGYNDQYKLDKSRCCAPHVDWPGVRIFVW